MLEFESVRMQFPADANLILGQSHFIKTVEDLYEAVVGTVPQAKFGLAFNESSGPCLIRSEGNDDELRNAAIRNAQALGAGHVFVLILRDAYPINLLNVVQNIPEVCSIFCATANPVEVVVAKSDQGRGVMGVIDGSAPKGVETPADVTARKDVQETAPLFAIVGGARDAGLRLVLLHWLIYVATIAVVCAIARRVVMSSLRCEAAACLAKGGCRSPVVWNAR